MIRYCPRNIIQSLPNIRPYSRKALVDAYFFASGVEGELTHFSSDLSFENDHLTNCFYVNLVKTKIAHLDFKQIVSLPPGS